jgi:ActR/RegA family two-component response regulator
VALVVDDVQLVVDAMSDALAPTYDVLAATNFVEAMGHARRDQLDLAVVDLYLRNPDFGRCLISTAREAHPEMKIVAYTSMFCAAALEAAIDAGANFCADKLKVPVPALIARIEGAPHDPDVQPLTLSELEDEYIKAVLLQTNGNKTQAAKILGIPRTSHLRKLGKLGSV